MPQISIIVPVYGVEKYLNRCLDTILSQTFTDWECLLVDDGSKDRSGDICDEYAQKDCRFRVFHKKNEGVSSARNFGVREAKGEWCCFVDSDDWIEPKYLQNFFVEEYSKYGCIMQSFYFEYENTNQTKLHQLPEKRIVKSSELAYFLEYVDPGGVHNGFIWHRIFKLSIIKSNQIVFPVGISFAEDGIFFLKYICHTNNFYITSLPGYHYLKRSNSLTSKGHTVSSEINYITLEYISEAVSKIIQKDCSDGIILNGLKLYLWRLLFTWILCRSMKCKDDYYRNQAFLLNYLKKYPINNDIRTNSIALKYIIELVGKSPTDLRFFVLCGLKKIYFIERKIRKFVTIISRVQNDY